MININCILSIQYAVENVLSNILDRYANGIKLLGNDFKIEYLNNQIKALLLLLIT